MSPLPALCAAAPLKMISPESGVLERSEALSALLLHYPTASPALRAALPVPATITPEPAASTDFTPVVRYGRYTLIELVSEPAQRDLMQQVVETTIPPALDASVGDALLADLHRAVESAGSPSAPPTAQVVDWLIRFSLPADALRIRAGLLEESPKLALAFHFHTDSRAGWWPITDDLTCYPEDRPPG